MADLVIVGAGPQALTLSCLLLQKRPRLHRRLRIVDPSGRWLSRWQRQMERYEIPWLRSPSPHHPHPNANALRQFAQARQRSRQLEGPYGPPSPISLRTSAARSSASTSSLRVYRPRAWNTSGFPRRETARWSWHSAMAPPGPPAGW